MENLNQEEALKYFIPLYILNKLYEDGIDNPKKYENDEVFLSELQKFQNQDESLLTEVSEATSDKSGKYDNIWNKVKSMVDSNEKLAFMKNGAKLDKIKKLRSMKKKPTKNKKCRCGCDLIETVEKGGKITSRCACGCDVVKIKKEKGGILTQEDLNGMVGMLESSIFNKWERQMKSNRIKKFKK